MITRWRRWRRLRALRAKYARHTPTCPAAPAFVPLWAIGVDYRACTSVHHPPWPCAYDDCGVPVQYSTRANRPKKGPRVYCCPEHKDAAGRPLPLPRKPFIDPPPQPRRVPRPQPCPRPDKLAFTTAEEAEERFATMLASDGTLNVYPCRCGYFHAGRAGPDPAQTIARIARIHSTPKDQP